MCTKWASATKEDYNQTTSIILIGYAGTQSNLRPANDQLLDVGPGSASARCIDILALSKSTYPFWLLFYQGFVGRVCNDAS